MEALIIITIIALLLVALSAALIFCNVLLRIKSDMLFKENQQLIKEIHDYKIKNIEVKDPEFF